MTVTQFEALVRKLEHHAKEQPGAYQAHVGLLAALGYIYIIGLGLTALIGVVFRAFQVHFPIPEDAALERAQAPRLFAALYEICERLRVPRFHHLLMEDDLNAFVSQHPRFGLLGGRVNYLVLGRKPCIPARSRQG